MMISTGSKMNFTETKLKGAYILDLEKLQDNRGFFARMYCEEEFRKSGISFSPVQGNVSFNQHKYTLRGMHYQEPPFEEAKLVRCTRGAIYDVIIDIRPESPTANEWVGVELTAENRKMIFIPKGFAHGFLTLEEETEVNYLMSEFYKPGAGRGIRWDDPAFNIDWPAEVAVISEKDKNWPPYKTAKLNVNSENNNRALHRVKNRRR